MNEENEKLGAKFAKKFNKKYGIITYSGTLAIETALISLNLPKKSKILVLSEVCYSIINTILKLDLVPVIVESKNYLYFIDEDIDDVLSKEKISCILLVHQYGILNDIDLKKYKEKGIKIIEDVAQAWDIGSNNYKVGKYSDIVVTSFGKTKPLSYGIGGGLFFNNKFVFNNIDYYDTKSREKNTILISYTYPLSEQIDYELLTNKASKIVKEQRENAKRYYELLKNQSNIKYINYDSRIKNTWHRFPIWIEDNNLYRKIVSEIKTTNLQYQLLHKLSIFELKRNEKSIKYINNNFRNIILLRTRNVDMNRQLLILKKIINKNLIK